METEIGRIRNLEAERFEQLRQILSQNGFARIQDLCEQIKVSPATVRRDLAKLAKMGKIRRVHGGAAGIETRLEEPLFDQKTSIAAEEKRRIAEAALSFVGPSETIYLDGGSTVLKLARLLRERPDITVVTNSLRTAVELAVGGPRVIMVGGELRRISQTLVGPVTRLGLEGLYLDKAFMGTTGIALEEGLTTPDPSEAYTHQLVIEHARQVILLADSSKVGKVSFARSVPLEKVHVLITDKKIDRKFVSELQKRGIEVVEG